MKHLSLLALIFISNISYSMVDQKSLLARMGLKDSDVIQEINGKRIDNAQAAQAVLEETKTAEHITVKFLRAGKPQTVSFKVK